MVSAPGTALGQATSPGRNSPELISWTQSPEARSGGGVGTASARLAQPSGLQGLEGGGKGLAPKPLGSRGSRAHGSEHRGGGLGSDPEPDCTAPDGLSACVPGGGLLTPAPGTVRPRCLALRSGSVNVLPAGLDAAGLGAAGGEAPSRTLTCSSVSQPRTPASTCPAQLPWPHSQPPPSPPGWSLCDPAPALSCHGNHRRSNHHRSAPGPHRCPLLGLPPPSCPHDTCSHRRCDAQSAAEGRGCCWCQNRLPPNRWHPSADQGDVSPSVHSHASTEETPQD